MPVHIGEIITEIRSTDDTGGAQAGLSQEAFEKLVADVMRRVNEQVREHLRREWDR